MRTFPANGIDSLVRDAADKQRRRQHWNLHASHHDSCQRLFNAIGEDSYIRPHRHCADGRHETLVAIRGNLALVTFDDAGVVNLIVPLAPFQSSDRPETSVGAEVGPEEWHTVLALEPGSVLLEIKAGPYDGARAKEYAPWSPAEGSREAMQYLEGLRRLADAWGSPRCEHALQAPSAENVEPGAGSPFVRDRNAS